MSFFKSDVHESLLAVMLSVFLLFRCYFFLSVHPRLVYFESNCIRTHYVRCTLSLKKVKCAQTSAMLSSSSSSSSSSSPNTQNANICAIFEKRNYHRLFPPPPLSIARSSLVTMFILKLFLCFSALYRLSSSFFVRNT